MSARIKTLFLALFLGVSATVNAQENANKKYEYISVTQNTNYFIHISRARQPLQEIMLPKNVKSVYDYSELFEQIENLELDGWKVYTTQAAGGNATSTFMTFILRREKK